MQKLLTCLPLLFLLISCVTNPIEPEPLCLAPIPPLTVKIESIRNNVSSDRISVVKLSNFYINETTLNPNEAIFGGQDIEFDGNSIICNEKCQFDITSEEGTYKFDVSAIGYVTKTVEFMAKYKSCGLWESLEDLNIRLDSE